MTVGPSRLDYSIINNDVKILGQQGKEQQQQPTTTKHFAPTKKQAQHDFRKNLS